MINGSDYDQPQLFITSLESLVLIMLRCEKYKVWGIHLNSLAGTSSALQIVQFS